MHSPPIDLTLQNPLLPNRRFMRPYPVLFRYCEPVPLRNAQWPTGFSNQPLPCFPAPAGGFSTNASNQASAVAHGCLA